MRFLRKHLETIIVATIVAAITAGTPAIAHGVRHALFAHRAGVAENAKKFAGRTPKALETQMSTATIRVTSSLGATHLNQTQTTTGTIRIINSGPGNATGVDLTATSLQWYPTIAPTPRCSAEVNVLSCVNLTIGKGKTFTLPVTWTGTACPQPPQDFPLTVEASGWKYDETPGNNMVSHSISTGGCP